MSKTAIVFPGQGSQYVGMGKDFYHEFTFAKEIFDMAEEVTNKPIKRLCFEGPLEELTRTANLQPAVTAVNLCASFALKREGFIADYSAGHSLGEYAALFTMSVINERDTMVLVNARGEYMDREASVHAGSMAALIGLDYNQVSKIVNSLKDQGVCAIANHNDKTQIVISGTEDMISQACRIAGEQGARSIPLKVSGAWHSQLMAQAQIDFTEVLDDADFNQPEGKILFNVTARMENDPKAIREIMRRQICSPVRWYDTVQTMLENDVSVFVEAGPKKVLQGLIKKIAPRNGGVQIFGVENPATLDKFLNSAVK